MHPAVMGMGFKGGMIPRGPGIAAYRAGEAKMIFALPLVAVGMLADQPIGWAHKAAIINAISAARMSQKRW